MRLSPDSQHWPRALHESYPPTSIRDNALITPPRARSSLAPIVAAVIAAVLVIAWAALSLDGCAGAQVQHTPAQNLTIATNISAHGLRLTDDVVDAAIHAQTLPIAPARDAQLRAVTVAETDALRILLLVEHANDAGQNICALRPLVSELASALTALAQAATAAGLAIPADITSAIPMLSSLASIVAPSCADGGQ